MIEFRHSVALRLALICGALVVVATLLLSAVFYLGTIGILARDADARIVTISERLVASAQRDGMVAVSRRIQQYLNDGVDTDSEIYLLTDDAGHHVAGNITGWTDGQAPEDQVIDHRVAREGKSYEARVLLHRLAGGALLVVGRDISDLNEIGRLVVHAIEIGAALALLLSAVGTIIFHRKIEGRISSIRHTARDIEVGNLSRRIPVSDEPDEFDRLGAEINHMLDRIEKLMDGVRHVSNIVAHNLRTPLGRIRRHLEVVLQGYSGTQALEEAGHYAVEQIDSLIVVLDKLLQIAEAESGTHRQPFEIVHLGDVIAGIVDLYDAAFEAQGIAAIVQVKADPMVMGDKDLLASLLANLLDNALKYAGGTASIEIAAYQDHQNVVVIVQDHGPGIAPMEREKVLHRFYRLDNTQEGSGLGLSIVAALVHLHSGALYLESAEPGLRVRIVLPAATGQTLPNGNVSTAL